MKFANLSIFSIAFALAWQVALPLCAEPDPSQSAGKVSWRDAHVAKQPDPLVDDQEELPRPDSEDSPDETFDDWIDVDDEPLPPLEEELWNHGGSYLYAPEGDRLNWPAPREDAHFDLLRLPENYQKPLPLEAFAEFLGADEILINPCLRWLGSAGYAWEPRFVGHGSYEVFGFALEENGQRQDVVGHQLAVDFDLRLTGTERVHVQYRPIGREATGGSYFQFSNPAGYVDNSTGEPDRYWFEMELHSVLGADVDPFAALDYNLTVGRVPLALHNDLLINDELLAVVLSKNTIIFGNVSNLNVQGIYGFNDVSAQSNDGDAELYSIHASVDRHRVFYEATWALLEHDSNSARDTHYAAFSATNLFGPTTVAVRGMIKHGDEDGRGNGQLIVVESNRTRLFEHNCCEIEKGVFYANAFYANDGWNPIANGNFNRLRSSFEVNPLVRISSAPPVDDVWGAAFGVQLFRHHEDESIIPEIAYEAPGGTPVVGFGLRYLRKTSSRTYVEALGIVTIADDPAYDREGVFLSHTIVF